MNSFIKWISKHHYLAAISLVVAILLGLFSAIVEEVYENDSKVVNFDTGIAKFITENRDSLLNRFFIEFTQLGNTVPLLSAFIIALVFFYVYKKYNQLLFLTLTFLGSGVITFVIKNIVQRARPIDGLIVEHGFSFPSGHAFAAVCFWAVLFYLLSTLTKNRPLKVALMLGGIVLAALLGFSRVYIGVHWPSDVIASYILSGTYVIVVFSLFRKRIN